jgi:hypothetical protein
VGLVLNSPETSQFKDGKEVGSGVRPLEPQLSFRFQSPRFASGRRIKEQTLAAVKQHNDLVSRVIVEEEKKTTT